MSAKDHICVKQAICFQCFRAGAERTRARQEAYAQRQLPFGESTAEIGAREVAHRQRMLDHLSRQTRRGA
jgi:hypothetical protein